MLIALEGCDGVGKSTFARRLRHILLKRQHSVVELHRGPLKEHPLEEYVHALDDYRPGSGYTVICDRWHWGEDIYGPLLRGESRMTPEIRLHTELYLRSRGAVMVHCDQDVLTTLHRIGERGENLITLDAVPHLLKAYRAKFDRSRLPRLAYTSLDDGDAEKVIMCAGGVESDVWHLAEFPTYIGPPKPRTLLLGDVRNTREGKNIAAFTPYPATSGNFLLGALLQTMRYDNVLHNVGISNACEPDQNPHDLWMALGRPSIVALGNNSSAALDAQGIPHVKVNHPQHARRFYHAQQRLYGLLLHTAMREAGWSTR